MGPDRHMKLIGMWSRGELACSEEFLIALGSGVRPGRVLSHNGVRYSILATTIPYDDTRAAWRKRLCAALPPKPKRHKTAPKATPEEIMALKDAVGRLTDIPAVMPKEHRSRITFDQSFDDRKAVLAHQARRNSWLADQRAALRLAKDGEVA